MFIVFTRYLWGRLRIIMQIKTFFRIRVGPLLHVRWLGTFQREFLGCITLKGTKAAGQNIHKVDNFWNLPNKFLISNMSLL